MSHNSVTEFLELNYKRFLPADKNARILDIGCGSGVLLKYFLDSGYKNISGFDRDPKCVELIKVTLTKQVEWEDDLVRFFSKQKAKYDLILLKEVLYYFTDDQLIPYLKKIRDSLSEDGQVIVEVFNGALLTGPFIKYKDYQIKRIFTEHSLKDVLQDAGFEVTTLCGCEMPTASIKRKIFYLYVKAWNLILRAIYLAERGLDPNNPKFYQSRLIAVARAPK